MSTDSFIRITPDVIFSAAVFTPVQLAQPLKPVSKRGQKADREAPEIDPRQIDLWDDDAERAPA
jgi:hypothetical protein